MSKPKTQMITLSGIVGQHARSTINRGKADLDAQPLPKGRVRRAGGGRRSVCENHPGLIPALKRLVEPATLGDPLRPLIWVSKSMEKLAATPTQKGYPISADTVCTELVTLGKVVPYGVYDVTPTLDSSASGSRATPPSSPCSRSAAGSNVWDDSAIPTHGN
jgi:hypothetical protein